MVRVIIKGGVWRNTEDEILKAAVMKYGKNQWSRVASLLHRKSAKQCKARWFEWLDPSIRKTEWSREEDEKLLHLAKLMPTQWRTIAPIVGRTASQCLERYEFLLDQAQKKAEGTTDDDPRKLKPGEIDPTPETKPARPDPVDMDEDELEMLSEARARLANTQGKKAKRKAREKQLDEARRLASLQKRREMKAAGLPLKKKFNKKRRLIDYNADIPFEKRVPAGFHDPSIDEFEKPDLIDPKEQRRDKQERQDRKTDRDRAKKRKEDDTPKTIFENEALARKRSKLVLPEPQISETEIDEVLKVGRASGAAKEAAEALGGSEASSTLLHEYRFGEAVSSLRTPRDPVASSERIMEDAATLFAIQNMDTPLKGGDTTPLADSLFAKTPKSVEAITDGKTPGRTPGRFSTVTTPGTTPRRDELKINPDEYAERNVLKHELRSLPAPKNDYEILLPESESSIATDATDATNGSFVEDAAILDERRRAKAQEEIDAMWSKQSTSVQRNLPRPMSMNHAVLRPRDVDLSALQKAEELIKREMLTLLHHDALMNPSETQLARPSGAAPSGWFPPKRKPDQPPPPVVDEEKHVAHLAANRHEDFEDDDLKEAESLLEAEEAVVRRGMAHDHLTQHSFAQVWDECYSQVLYVPGQSKYTRANQAPKKDRIESMEKRLELYRSHMAAEAKRAGKSEKKMKVLLGGYQSRAQNLIKSLTEAVDQLDDANVENGTFAAIEEHETAAIPGRVQSLQKEVSQQAERERELQEKYKQLLTEMEEMKEMEKRELASTSAPAAIYLP